jgi:hypothetical protein
VPKLGGWSALVKVTSPKLTCPALDDLPLPPATYRLHLLTMPPFGFLDLTTELRLMMYERLYSTTHHYNVELPSQHSGGCAPDAAKFDDVADSENASENIQAAVIMGSFPVAILATCKVSHQEAKPVVAVELQKLAQTSVRITIGSAAVA